MGAGPQDRRGVQRQPRLRRSGRLLVRGALALLVVFAASWSLALVNLKSRKQADVAGASAPVVRKMASALLDPEAKSTAYLDEAALEFLNPLRGESGKLRVAFRTP